MFNIEKIYEYENSFPKDFTMLKRKPYGNLFYNTKNPESHDSNHCIITNLNADLDEVIKDIKTFYEEKGLTPRIFQGFLENETELLKPILIKHGFKFSEYENRIFVFNNEKETTEEEVNVKKLKKIDIGIENVILSEDEGDFGIKVLRNHIKKKNFHLLGIYDENIAVSILSLKVMRGYSRIDDVITHKDHRKRGFCTKLINHAVNYHKKISDNILYLYACNPSAIKIYEKAGFNEIESDRPFWSAYIL